LYRQSLGRHGYDPTAGQVTLLVHTFIGRDLDSVRDTVRKPFCDYLKSTVGIIQNVITSLDLRLDLNSLTAKDMDDLLSYAFERYFQANALMGTPELALDKIALLEEIGVNEIACFVDFGVDAKLVMESLTLLNEVRERSRSINHSADVRVDVRDFWANARERCVESISGSEHYEKLRARGMKFGPSFTGVQNIWKGEAEAIGELDLPSLLEADVEAYEFHPAMLDAGLQLFMTILPANDEASIRDRIYAPVGIGEVRVHSKPDRKMWAHVSLRPETGVNAEVLVGDLRIFDQGKRLIAESLGIRLQALETTTPTSAAPTFDNLLYELEWEPLASERGDEAKELSDQQGAWLIFTDEGGIGQQVSKLLSNHGHTCIHVFRGQSYLALTENHFCIDHHNAEDFKTLLRDINRSTSMPLIGIVHLWSLDATATETTTISSLRRAQALGCESVMGLLQGLAEHQWAEPPKLWLVTRGAQHLGSEDLPIAIAQSPIWGLQRVIRIEHPELRCAAIDLDPSDTLEYTLEFLLAELRINNNEDQIALRGDKLYAPRLTRCTKNSWPKKLTLSDQEKAVTSTLETSSSKFSERERDVDGAPLPRVDTAVAQQETTALFRQDGTYLITGGFGVLGIILARHMVKEGARHLVLIGRRGSSSTSGQVLDELRSSGAEIREMKCDVSEEEEVASVLAQIKDGMPPLRGIIHAAMWIEDSVLLQLDHDRFDAAIKPKVLGAWNLHSLTRDLPLDFFVLFSSAASLLGSAGQGNYVAANAFLDALSHYRKFMRLPSLTMDWGPWAETHLQSRKLTERMAMIGMMPLLSEQGLAALNWMVQHQCAQVMIMAANWEQVSKSYPLSSRPAILSRLWAASSRDVRSLNASSETAGLGRQQFMAMAPDNRPAWLESHILTLVGNVLRLDQTQIDPHQPLNALGLDSLMAIEIKNEIENSLAVSLPLVRFLEGPDVTQLAAQVLSQLPPTTAEEENERLTGLLKQVTELSDEEAREMLAREKEMARSES
jgi:short-subunit dehydrogenase/acyl carrier protein